MSRSLKICVQVESWTIVAGYSAVAPNKSIIEYIKYDENLHGDPSTMTVGSEREKWIQGIAYKTGRKAGRDHNIISNQS